MFESFIDAAMQASVMAQNGADAGAAAAADGPRMATTVPGGSLGFWVVMLASMALLPFLFTMVTAFAKLVIVGGIIRQALGTPQIPPNTVLTGLAIILTVHIMWPVGEEAYDRYLAAQQAKAAQVPAEGAAGAAAQPSGGEMVRDIVNAVEPPLRRFLERHAHPKNIAFFERLQAKLRASHADGSVEGAAPDLDVDPQIAQLLRDLSILAPAFMLSELIEAFQVGFLIFVPFLVIDLAVSNILLAMGMHMLSPVTISMPFKLLLFVLIDGWTMIIQGIVLSYT